MKKLLTILTLLAVMVGTAACGDSKTKNKVNSAIDILKHELEIADRQCPYNAGAIGDLISIKYIENTNEVQLYIIINDKLFDLDVLEKNKRLARRSAKLALTLQKQTPKQSEEVNRMLKSIIDADARLVYTYKSNSYGKSFNIRLSPDDLREIYDTPSISNLETNKLLFECNVALENAQCPLTIDEGMTMTKAYDDGSNLIYECRIDEQMYDIDMLKYNKSEMKRSVKSTFNGPMASRHINLCSSLGKGLIYRYYGDTSGKNVDIVFTPEELREAMNEIQNR